MTSQRYQFTPSKAFPGLRGGLPFVDIYLTHKGQGLHVSGLVDSGSTINVLPYDYGLQLGLDWHSQDLPLQGVGYLEEIPSYIERPIRYSSPGGQKWTCICGPTVRRSITATQQALRVTIWQAIPAPRVVHGILARMNGNAVLQTRKVAVKVINHYGDEVLKSDDSYNTH